MHRVTAAPQRFTIDVPFGAEYRQVSFSARVGGSSGRYAITLEGRSEPVMIDEAAVRALVQEGLSELHALWVVASREIHSA